MKPKWLKTIKYWNIDEVSMIVSAALCNWAGCPNVQHMHEFMMLICGDLFALLHSLTQWTLVFLSYLIQIVFKLKKSIQNTYITVEDPDQIVSYNSIFSSITWFLPFFSYTQCGRIFAEYTPLNVWILNYKLQILNISYLTLSWRDSLENCFVNSASSQLVFIP